ASADPGYGRRRFSDLQSLMLALALAFLAAAPSPTPRALRPLSQQLPARLPDPAVLARWELIQGQADSNGSPVSYRFYVDPARPAIYRLTQYRLAMETEKLLWNAAPGARVLECYELLADGWHRLEPGTERYRLEMATAIRVYQLHNSIPVTVEP
ncbi:MAG TPA: hypothetical protein VF310_15180, partial [Vicinamibacteria bacterium]